MSKPPSGRVPGPARLRVVFLDFDGVLNSAPYLYDGEARTAGQREAGEAGAIDPVNVRRLNRLLRRTGAKVVISSSWRHVRDISQLRAILRVRGLRGTVIDKTPEWVTRPGGSIVVGTYGERGDEIRAWLDGAQGQCFDRVESFVVLDDDSDMTAVRERFVQTSMETGLTDQDVERAIAILERR